MPVATVGIGNARNAGLLAARILATADGALAARVAAHQQGLRELAMSKDEALQDSSVADHVFLRAVGDRAAVDQGQNPGRPRGCRLTAPSVR